MCIANTNVYIIELTWTFSTGRLTSIQQRYDVRFRIDPYKQKIIINSSTHNSSNYTLLIICITCYPTCFFIIHKRMCTTSPVGLVILRLSFTNSTALLITMQHTENFPCLMLNMNIDSETYDINLNVAAARNSTKHNGGLRSNFLVWVDGNAVTVFNNFDKTV